MIDNTGYTNEALMNSDVAAVYLGNALADGSLALVLGAGISKKVGLPQWYELVNDCLEAVGLVGDLDKSTPNNKVLLKMDEVEAAAGSPSVYRNIVKSALYKKSNITEQVFDQKLLLMIGALVLGAKRGNVKEILTFNFDSVLEYYLSLYGIQSQVIVNIPCLRREKDVTIYHPHGFLSTDEDGIEDSNFIVLSQYSYDERLGRKLDPWKELTRDFFERKTCLFLGLSGDDPAIRAIITTVDDQVKKERPTGFWMFGHGIDNKDDYLRRNVIPVCFDSFDDYPDFLIKICQQASNASK